MVPTSKFLSNSLSASAISFSIQSEYFGSPSADYEHIKQIIVHTVDGCSTRTLWSEDELSLFRFLARRFAFLVAAFPIELLWF